MKPNVLVIVADDPRVSARPAEAIRIAAGVGAWKKADVSVYLRDAAILMLGEHVDELVDDENYVRYLPMLANLGRPIYVQHGAPLLLKLGRASLAFEEVSDQRLANMAASSNYVVRFQ